MRKVMLTMLLVVAVIIVGAQNNRAEAYDIYVGTYDSGLKAYLMTEYINYNGYRTFDCTIKATGYMTVYVDYSFWNYAGESHFHFKNSQGYSGIVSPGSVEDNIVKNYQSLWSQRIRNR